MTQFAEEEVTKNVLLLYLFFPSSFFYFVRTYSIGNVTQNVETLRNKKKQKKINGGKPSNTKSIYFQEKEKRK